MNLTWQLLGLEHGDVGRSVSKDREEDREEEEVDLQESVKTPLLIM